MSIGELYSSNTRGSMLARNGVRRWVRPLATQQRALEGHKQSAHGGKFIDSCPACREMSERESEYESERQDKR
jgi:hypothetical protein